MQYLWCLGVFALVVIALLLVAARRRAPRRSPAKRTRITCVDCLGRGWTQRRRRTLTFDGTAFTDIDEPAVMCVACDGTGSVLR